MNIEFDAPIGPELSEMPEQDPERSNGRRSNLLSGVAIGVVLTLVLSACHPSWWPGGHDHAKPVEPTPHIGAPPSTDSSVSPPPTPMAPSTTTSPVTTVSTTVLLSTTTGVDETTTSTTSADGSGSAGGSGSELVWGYDETPQSGAWSKPELLVAYVDAAYGTSVRRLTDATGTRFDRNTYSRRQAENADGTRFLTYHGDAEYHVYDRQSGALVQALDIHPDSEPQWHPTDPNKIRHILGPNSYVGDLKLYEVDVVSGEDVMIADLTSRIQAVIPDAAYMLDMAEGSPSSDGTRFAWIVMNGNEAEVGLVSYDLSTDTVLGVNDGLPAMMDSYGPIDWVSMSPTGAYVVAGFWDGDLVFDHNVSNLRVLNQEGSHSDLALQSDGSDVWVYIDYDDANSPDAGWLVSIDLDSLHRERLFKVYGGATTSIHVSGKGFDKPGWVVVSTYNCSDPGAWTCTKIFAVELAGEHRVLNIAHTYNCGDDYWTETQGVVNRAFTRVYFNSDSGSCGTDAEVYEVSVPDFG